MMIELISGVTYRSGLMNDIEVEDAVSRGQVPQVPMVAGKHRDHEREEKVQAYLRKHGIRAGLTYQSMFVGWNTGTAVEKEIVCKYGIPLVVNPALTTGLVVACLGDLQNVVCSIAEVEDGETKLDHRIINLETVTDPIAALRELVERSEAHNKEHHANPLYVEARIYRRWDYRDFIRPCLPDDYKPRRSKQTSTFETSRIRRLSDYDGDSSHNR
jgi:hypothetical protein